MVLQKGGQAGHTHPSDGTAALGVVTRLSCVGTERAPCVGGHISQVGRGKGSHERALPRPEEPCSAQQGKLQSPGAALPTAAVTTKRGSGLFPKSLEHCNGGLGTSQGAGWEKQGRIGCTWCHFRENFTPPRCTGSVSSSPSPTSALPSVSPASHVADQMFTGYWSTLHRIFFLPGVHHD